MNSPDLLLRSAEVSLGRQKGSGTMAFYVKMSTAPGECAREAMRQGLGVSAAVAIGYTVVNHDHGKLLFWLAA